MGKKNIKPSINQPVIRTHVAKPALDHVALEGLTEESLTSSTNNTSLGLAPNLTGCGSWEERCSYDGDDAE
ncbi:MAG: microcyclamide/patellamide family RiPP [Okeania sp. SIO2C2]|uniref:DUF5837 family cyanobactin class RiPP n=1 Tax=Okeania sp. SIO2C2 TaxID=2607787 RepID=UPI0013B90EB9|nr:DUF5837 family cyanobactin class RiPP [Okeania sp. SIO2C2]NEP91248.1 microcyclamide/patellamide family RiPP [Okeania sp. SIO2C2]